jgi:hypothetical protein
MLTVKTVIPKGPAHEQLETGDILLKVNDNQIVTTFIPLEFILDDNIGKSIRFTVIRGGQIKQVEILVQDLHSITPDEYVEVCGGLFSNLSYQMAKSYCIPVNHGIYVAAVRLMKFLPSENNC